MPQGCTSTRRTLTNSYAPNPPLIPWWKLCSRESGLELNQADRFYVAGAFGKHVSKESAITIGMYPDMDRDHIINAGNSSLEGAQKLLLNRSLLTDIDQILEEMVYIQFAEVEDFLELMVAAQALPHTDYKRYPTVMEKLKERQKDIKL